MAWLRLRDDATVRPQFFANSESFLASAPPALGRRYARWSVLCAAVARATERPKQPATQVGPQRPETAPLDLPVAQQNCGAAQDADVTEPTEVWNLDGVADDLIATLRPARIDQAVRFVTWEAAALVEAMHPTPSAANVPAARWPVERRGRWLWGFARLAEVIDRIERGEQPAITALRVLGIFDESPEIVRTMVANAIERERLLLPRTESEIDKARALALHYPDIFGGRIDPPRRNPLIDEAADLVGAWPERKSEIPDLVHRLREVQPHSRSHGRSHPRVAPDRGLYRIELLLSALSGARPKLYEVALALTIAERPVRLLNRLLPHAVRDMAEALSLASFGLPWPALRTHLPAPGLLRPGPALWLRGMDESTEADQAPWLSALARGVFEPPPLGRRRNVLHYRQHLMFASTLARGRAARNFATNLARADFAFLARTEARPEGPVDELPAGCHGSIEWWYWRDYSAAPFSISS